MDELKPGIYESVITEALLEQLQQQGRTYKADRRGLDPGDSHLKLARTLFESIWRALNRVRGDEQEKARKQTEVCNRLIEILASAELLDANDNIVLPPQLLTAVYDAIYEKPPFSGSVIPLNESALLVNAGDSVNLSAAIQGEISSADSVDLLCAFINFTGIQVLHKQLEALCTRGRLRVITTTYLGATQQKAIDLLVKLGAEVKITYEQPPSSTKLHAKAWLFHRITGFDTAYIGSSNISRAALVDGLEWNVRLSNAECPAIIKKFKSTFEDYWLDERFEQYVPGTDNDKLKRALASYNKVDSDSAAISFLDVHPMPHQQQMLQMLAIQRERHGRNYNLIVAATGTGKTVVAALDFKRLAAGGRPPSLLFVAHRKEILTQSQFTYRNVLREGGFGELWVDGEVPTEYRHVFASIQTLARFDTVPFAPNAFDIVVVDEFHHAHAGTYRKLLEYLQPKYLLGLTATPERTDGFDVRRFFDGQADVELRLWDALQSQLLCPFVYFGLADNTDLSDVEWRQGHYDIGALEQKYVRQGENRAALVLAQLEKHVLAVDQMRAIGFCVSKAHAEFMAAYFNKCNVHSIALTADSPPEVRRSAVSRLRLCEINIIFAVDIFNEGVDIPAVDTVLFLRPTESATIFLQQLGRGLRNCEGKPCLTVLDFIGKQYERFRFDMRYRALTGQTRKQLAESVTRGFATLPPGCSITLDRVSTQEVLRSIQNSLPNNTKALVYELQSLASTVNEISLSGYLEHTGISAEDLYTKTRCFTTLKQKAGLVSLTDELKAAEERFGMKLYRTLTTDDNRRLEYYVNQLKSAQAPRVDTLHPYQQRLLYMLAATLKPNISLPELQDEVDALWQSGPIREELIELLTLINEQADCITYDLEPDELRQIPLRRNARYSRDELMAAFGLNTPSSLREGVRYFDEQKTDVLLVTLRKTEKEYSESTRYRDYPISRDLFHWESQSRTRASHSAGKRYITHQKDGGYVVLMVREQKELDGVPQPYYCLGTADYVSHESEMPMQIVWKLHHPIPETLYQRFRQAAG